MGKINGKLVFIGSILVLLLHAMPAQAQATRTWVSGVGDDANPCSRTAPCKTFAGAISKTAAGGEISVLDPGGFGAVTITKAISITNDGAGEAGILASGTNGITVNAGVNDVVNIRGIVIDGAPPAIPGLNGIRFLNGKALHIQNSVIKNFHGAAPNGFGILFAPAGAAHLFVTNTIISNNGSGANGGGIMIRPTGSGSARVALHRVDVHGNVSGARADGTGSTGPNISLYARSSKIAGSSLQGIFLITPAGGQPVNMVVDDTAVFGNGTGISANGSASVVFATKSTITVNTTGLATANGASIFSFANNNFTNNGVPGSFTPPTFTQQ